MRNALLKETRLAATPVTYFFILFSLTFLVPGYPVLCGAFFVTLGIFQSFRSARESNDILFSALLPVARKDVVTGKFLFVCLTELCAAACMAACAALRMTVLADVKAYRENALMNANLFALGMALVIFALFNLIFVAGFFKTAYAFGKPFILYGAAAFAVIFIAEALHYVPGLEKVNSSGADALGLQIVLLAAGVCLYALFTLLALRLSRVRFEKIDL